MKNLKSPFEKFVLKVINEQQSTSDIRKSLPKTISLDLSKENKILLKNAFNKLQSDSDFQALGKTIDSLNFLLKKISIYSLSSKKDDAFKSPFNEAETPSQMDLHKAFWYVGVVENLLKQIEQAKSTWGDIRNQVKQGLEPQNTEMSDTEMSDTEDISRSYYDDKEVPKEQPKKQIKPKSEPRSRLSDPETAAEFENSISAAVQKITGPWSQVYGPLNKKWAISLFKKAIEKGFASKEQIEKMIMDAGGVSGEETVNNIE